MINLFKKYQYRIVQDYDSTYYRVEFKRRFQWWWNELNTHGTFHSANKCVEHNIRKDNDEHEMVVYY